MTCCSSSGSLFRFLGAFCLNGVEGEYSSARGLCRCSFERALLSAGIANGVDMRLPVNRESEREREPGRKEKDRLGGMKIAGRGGGSIMV